VDRSLLDDYPLSDPIANLDEVLPGFLQRYDRETSVLIQLRLLSINFGYQAAVRANDRDSCQRACEPCPPSAEPQAARRHKGNARFQAEPFKTGWWRAAIRRSDPHE